MLLSCSFYTKERATFTGTIETISTLKIADSPKIFNILMNCNQGDIEFSKEICNYVNDCFIKQDLGLKQLKQIRAYPVSTETKIETMYAFNSIHCMYVVYTIGSIPSSEPL